jgi:hypothetical protein
VRVAILTILVSACSFKDGLVPAMRDSAVDAPIDVPPDAFVQLRAPGAVAMWTFRETGGTTLDDAIPGKPIPLMLSPTSMVTHLDGSLRIDARSTAVSSPTPHVNADAKKTGGVTLEAWVMPADATQGAAQYAVIASITVSVMLHNISLEQRGGIWAARVRTVATTTSGDPVIPGPIVDTSKPTHLVLVADATQRVLYVNGTPYVSAPEDPGVLTNWDPNFKIRFFDEDSADRHWQGTVWLVAMYARALAPAEIMQNLLAGPDCFEC